MKTLYWVAFAIFFLSLFGFIGCAETGLIELLTFVFFLLAAYWQFRIFRSGKYRLFSLLFMLLFLFGALEEISYGQHFFGYDVDTSAVNKQNETNVHNIDFYRIGCPEIIQTSIGCEGDDFIYFGVLLFGVALLMSLIPVIARFYRRIGFPGHYPLYGLAFGLVILLSYNLYFGCIQEFFDFLIALLFYGYSHDLNR
ncbi:MAG: hypothetical protein ACQESG_00235 [Nanobdellota archaeon]